MKPGALAWLLIAAAICLPVIASALSHLLLIAVVLFALAVMARGVWFFTR